jgi:intracellular sulfur oxidation DsrE/DsrF family protein
MEVTMKRMLAIVACGLLAAGMVRAQSSSSPKPYKVVFDLTTDDPQDQTAVLRWLREVATVNPQSEMEVVMYGRGLSLVVPGRSTLTDDVKQAIGRPHVSFKVCEIAMRNQKVDKSQLLPNVAIVPDGIGEIVARQKEGWGYIKAIAH